MSKRFGEKGDAFLSALYDSVGATTVSHKLTILRMKLGGNYHFYSMGTVGEVADEVKLACMEHELLEIERLIEVHYC